MKKILLLCMLSFVTIMASAQLTYDFNEETGVLTIGGNGTTVSEEDVNQAIGRGDYQSNKTLKEVVFTATGVTTIGDNSFLECESLTSITLPDGVTTIGPYAFSRCNSLTNIALPDGVTSIETSAFYCCESLTAITLPDGVATIGSSAFSGCNSLTNIALPDGVTTIGNGAFGNCSALTSITVSSQNAYFTSVDGVLFDKQKKVLLVYPAGREETSYIVPKGTESIENSVFSSCKSLTSITLQDGVTTIGIYAFSDCKSLTSITLPDGITSIEEGTFSGCVALTGITLPNTLTTIGGSAFNRCHSLTNITLPNTLTTIGGSAFNRCHSLTNITLPDGLTTIGKEAFTVCRALVSVTASSKNAYFASIDGVLFDKQKKVLLIYPAGRKETSYIVPKGTETIVESVFSYCESLISVTLQDGLTTLGNKSFQACTRLTSITLPDGLTTIGDYAFQYCSALTNITCLSKTEPRMGERVFYDSPSTRTVYVPNATSGFTPSNWGDYDTNVTIKYGEYPTGIQESVATAGFSTRVVNGSLFIEGLKPGTAYTVMSINGSLIAKGIATTGSSQVKVSGRGICIIHAAGMSRKVVY